ncbi:UNVERIFIED_CONTAM: hypothetical protein K2H54_047485 [Gekko kuhli]
MSVEDYCSRSLWYRLQAARNRRGSGGVGEKPAPPPGQPVPPPPPCRAARSERAAGRLQRLRESRVARALQTLPGSRRVARRRRRPRAMNCSEGRRLQRLLSRLLQELRGGVGGAAPPNGSSPALDPTGGAPAAASAPSRRAGDDAYLYILLIMIFYGCLAGGLILAYTRSRKLESKHDPYHLYIERDWAADAGEALGSGDGQRP